MTELTAHIHEGTVCKGYIPARQYVYPAVRFQYRALWPEALREFNRQCAAVERSGGDPTAVTATTLNETLTSWDVRYSDDHPDPEKRGQLVPINTQTLHKQIQPEVFRIMGLIVTGFRVSDVDPEDTPEDQTRAAAELSLSMDEFAELLRNRDRKEVGNSGGQSGS